jgi:formylglycine-generating enzyme required for sulfatase activity
MEATITLQGIDQAISDLNYRNPQAQKCRLVYVIRAAYDAVQPPQIIEHIDPEDLIKALWETGNDEAAIKARRKTLSSTKSAVNKDLKELFRQGKNPEGVTIGRDNVFVMSDEAKDKLLADFGPESAKQKAASLQQIAESLNAIKEILRSPDILSDAGGAGASPVLEDLRNTLRHLAQEVGTGESQGPEAQTGSQISKTDVGGSSWPGLTGREAQTTPGETGATAPVEDIKESDVQDEQLVEEILEVTDEDEVIEDLQSDEPAQEDDIEELLQEVDEDEVVEELPEQDQQDVEEILEEVDDVVALSEPGGQPGETGLDAGKEELGGEAEGGTGSGATLPGNGPHENPDKTEGAAPVEDIKESDVQVEQAVEEIPEVTDEDEVIGDLQSDEPAQEDDIEELLQEVDEDEVVEELPEQDQQDVEEILEEVDDVVALPGSDDQPGEIGLDAGKEWLAAEAEGASGSGPGITRDGHHEEPDAPGDVHGSYQDMESGGRAGEAGLAPADFEEGLDNGEEDDTDKARRLAEVFDGQLRTMERFYNQYLLVPEGEYTIGSKTPRKDEQSERKVRVASFYMGKFPVTNALFEVFIEKTGYVTTAERVGHSIVYYGRLRKEVDERTGLVRFTSFATIQSQTVPGACWFQPLGPGSNLHGKRNNPVVQVSLEDAMAFAAWTGKRLPTEEEWEASARTQKGSILPWGNDWIAGACNTEESAVAGTTPVDQFKERANALGLADMLGNVMEWTSNTWQADSTSRNGTSYVAKGGGWISGKEIRLFSRFKVDSGTTSNVLGFRCVA